MFLSFCLAFAETHRNLELEKIFTDKTDIDEQTMILLVLIGAVANGIVSWDDLIQLFKQVFGEVTTVLCDEEVPKLKEQIESSDALIILENQEPGFGVELDVLHKLALDLCAKKRKRVVHVVKNYSASKDAVTVECHRKSMFWQYDLETESLDQIATALKANKNDNLFSSPGESFAWQLATGFLSYVLPKLRSEIQSSLLNDEGLIRQQVLETFELTDVDPNKILVVPKYHLLLDKRIVSSQQSVPGVCPQLLFPGCRKVGNASTELSLEFDSPGYKKRVTAYLMELEKPLTKDKATYSHALIFCGYAAPMFIMQKLSMSDEDKKAMFEQFRDELALIQSHPRANAILREFSDCRLEDVRESEPSALQVIDIKEDEDSLRSSIYAAIDEFLLCDGWSIVSSTRQQPSSESVRDELPLMSMAFAMAANTWIGFAKLLNDYIQQLSSSEEQIPFDLPYLFVIPKSGRYPDESKMHSRFAELGVRSSQQEFWVSSGRRYTFRVHEWRSRRIAFEIPTCVLGLRKQAECSVGGIRAGDLGAHLAEFRDTLDRFAKKEGADRFKVLQWDDVTDFDQSLSIEPSCKFAESLLNACSSGPPELFAVS